MEVRQLLTLLLAVLTLSSALRPRHRPTRGKGEVQGNDDSTPPGLAAPLRGAWTKTLSRMFLYSFCLGPLLDNYHGLFDVLNYREGVPIVVQLQGHTVLKTALWVPPLFGCAGVTMSVIVLLLDRRLRSPSVSLDPSWSKVFSGIGFFSAQYYLSGLLDHLTVEGIYIHAVLAATALAGWAIYDSTSAGLLLGLATAIAGPAAEVLLTSLGLYSYTHADLLRVCSWIPWVYFLGAPAVGNLARRTFLDASRES